MTTAEKMRKLREERGLTLQGLHNTILEHYGPQYAIDYSTLKRIQAGKVKPNKFSLCRICMGLGVPLNALEDDKPQDLLVKFIPQNDPEGCFDYAPAKAHADRLSTKNLKGMLAQKLVIESKSRTIIEKDPNPTSEITYQKWVYGLRGEIWLIVEGKRYKITAGDSCFFESHHEHYFENESQITVSCLVIQCPPHL